MQALHPIRHAARGDAFDLGDITVGVARVEGLRAELKDWEDPAFVIAQARSRLHFVFPGEVGYVVLGEDDRPIVPEEQRTDEQSPWYSRLWDSTLQADRS